MSNAPVNPPVGEQIIINEVGCRDGLQSQPRHLTLDQRVKMATALMQTGLQRLEIGSFVSPKAVPQMAGTDELIRRLNVPAGIEISALIPNMRGYNLAKDASVTTVAVPVSATQTMNQKNINMSLEQTFNVAQEIIEHALQDGIKVQMYLAVAFECPFEGQVSPDTAAGQVRQLIEWGAHEIVIADTIGGGNPAQVRHLMNTLVAEHGSDNLTCHFHDTRAMGLANVYAAIESGIRRFDSSIGGLGGCPFAPGAKGNVATEDVVMLCEQMGFSTGISMPALLATVQLISDMIGAPQGGRAYPWLTRNAA